MGNSETGGLSNSFSWWFQELEVQDCVATVGRMAAIAEADILQQPSKNLIPGGLLSFSGPPPSVKAPIRMFQGWQAISTHSSPTRVTAEETAEGLSWFGDSWSEVTMAELYPLWGRIHSACPSICCCQKDSAPQGLQIRPFNLCLNSLHIASLY